MRVNFHISFLMCSLNMASFRMERCDKLKHNIDNDQCGYNFLRFKKKTQLVPFVFKYLLWLIRPSPMLSSTYNTL